MSSLNSINYKLITEFEKLVKHLRKLNIKHSTVENSMRLRAIKNALDIIKKHPTQIKSGKDLDHIKGVGKGVVKRIDEILKTGHLSEILINKLNVTDSVYRSVRQLTQIFGVGEKTAVKLITKHNIKSVDDLLKTDIKLPHHIKLGLKYYGLYTDVVPRDEIVKVDNMLQKVVKNISPNLIYDICGSFRRGKQTSSDIDILLTHKYDKNCLRVFVEKLKNNKFIIEDLDKDYKVKYMGFCKLNNGIISRIDVMFVPYTSYPTSILHFTGSGEFNRKMRELALELGYTLNQYGLYKVSKNKSKILIPTYNEKDVFDKLGMDYIEPNFR